MNNSHEFKSCQHRENISGHKKECDYFGRLQAESVPGTGAVVLEAQKSKKRVIQRN